MVLPGAFVQSPRMRLRSTLLVRRWQGRIGGVPRIRNIQGNVKDDISKNSNLVASGGAGSESSMSPQSARPKF